jgi:DNA-binding MarR family transcriptional regulator
MKEQLKLANQVCFPIYLLAKEIINQYRPILDTLDLTYSQYLVMLVLWEHGEQTVSELGEKLNLDSGTLTPLLKRLEQKKFIFRTRKSTDERVVEISTTALGHNLHKKAVQVPQQLIDSICISKNDFKNLKIDIENILTRINNNKKQ